MAERFFCAVVAAWDWADAKGIGVRLRRVGDDWFVRIAMGDKYGSYVADVLVPPALRGAGLGDPELALSEFVKALSRAYATARKDRQAFLRRKRGN